MRRLEPGGEPAAVRAGVSDLAEPDEGGHLVPVATDLLRHPAQPRDARIARVLGDVFAENCLAIEHTGVGLTLLSSQLSSFTGVPIDADSFFPRLADFLAGLERPAPAKATVPQEVVSC